MRSSVAILNCNVVHVVTLTWGYGTNESLHDVSDSIAQRLYHCDKSCQRVVHCSCVKKRSVCWHRAQRPDSATPPRECASNLLKSPRCMIDASYNSQDAASRLLWRHAIQCNRRVIRTGGELGDDLQPGIAVYVSTNIKTVSHSDLLSAIEL
jgi:hypothetical protein